MEYDAEVIDEMIRKITHTEYTFITELLEKMRPEANKGVHANHITCTRTSYITSHNLMF